MATKRAQVEALIQHSVTNTFQNNPDLDEDLKKHVDDLLLEVAQHSRREVSTAQVLESLCSELRSFNIIKIPQEESAFFEHLKTPYYREPFIIIASVLLDDSRFNSQIWSREQRLEAYYERVNALMSKKRCENTARESMIELLHGQFFFRNEKPLYLFRDPDIDGITLITESYANQLAPLLLHTDLQEQQRGFFILRDWIRYHYHEGDIPKHLSEFLNARSAKNYLDGVLSSNPRIDSRRLLHKLHTILQSPAELPPPYMPSFGRTTLTAAAIGRYNGLIATLHDLIRDPSQSPAALETCRTLDDILPIRLAFIRKATLKKAGQLANTIPLHPLHRQAIESASEIMRQCSELSDSEFADNLDALETRLSECRSLFESDEHGKVPDYFDELTKKNRREFHHDRWFKLTYWELQQRAFSCIDDENIGILLGAAETVPLLWLLTPRRLAYLIWPAFHISPKDWSKAYATLVDHLSMALIQSKKMKSYPRDLTYQLRWLHECWETRSLSLIPDELFMLCNLSGLRIDDERYRRNPLLWVANTRKRGWWVALPNNMMLTDISKDPNDIREMLSLCAYPQRLKELEKIWDELVQDPSVFPMLFQVLELYNPRNAQTLREFFPKIPPDQVRNCLSGVIRHDGNFLKAIELTRPDQLQAVLEIFFPFLFDEEFCQKYEALFVLLPNPVELIRKCVERDQKLRFYRVLCLTLPNGTQQSNVNTLFSRDERRDVAEKIYEVKKILRMITLFAKEHQLTPSAAAIRLAEDSQLDDLIELWKSRGSTHTVLWGLLVEVGELINIENLVLLNSIDTHAKIPVF